MPAEDHITIKEYLDSRITGLQDIVSARFDTLERSISKFETCITKCQDTHGVSTKAMQVRVDLLEQNQATFTGKMKAYGAIFTVILTIVLAGVQVVLRMLMK